MRQRAIGAVSSLRSRATALASSQLRGVAGDLLADALGKLEGRLRVPVSAIRSSERMREVLERDRALAFAADAASAAAQPLTSPTLQAPKAEPCNEPIRTRTFARLLAAQGHVERALSIYGYLLEQHPRDAALMDEAALLSASLGSPSQEGTTQPSH